MTAFFGHQKTPKEARGSSSVVADAHAGGPTRDDAIATCLGFFNVGGLRTFVGRHDVEFNRVILR